MARWWPRYARSITFAWLKLPPADVAAGFGADPATAPAAVGFQAVMRAKAAQYGKVRYGDKTPTYTP